MKFDAFSYLTKFSAWIFLILPLFMFFIFFEMSLPYLKYAGLSFLVTDEWVPSRNKFGALGAACGSFITSLLAIVIATPLSFGLSIFMTEIANPFFSKLCQITIDIMAGIPSIIFGMWALFTLSPYIYEYLELPLYGLSDRYPFLKHFFLGDPNGLGFFTSGCVLAFMIIPYMTSLIADVFRTMPKMTRESAYGLGLTSYEYFRHILFRYTYSGALGALILGLGRALGETMAVTFVIGHSPHLAFALFGAGTTISASIANEFSEAMSELHVSALIELGFILLFMSFTVISLGKFLTYSLNKKYSKRS
jgi:phosphate transport system permease protein